MKLATYFGHRVIILSEPNPDHWLLWFEDGRRAWMSTSLTSAIETVDDQWLVGLRAQLGVMTGTITSYRYDPAYPIGQFIGFTPDGNNQHERIISLYVAAAGVRLQITLTHHHPRMVGRPRSFATNADRQRAYRERQKALRNSAK